MAELPSTLSDTARELAKPMIANLVKTIAAGMGGHAADAVKLAPPKELEAWMRETASPQQVAQMIADGEDDEAILKKSRKYRYHLGRAAGGGDPKKEVAYHELQAARQVTYREALGRGVPHEQALAEALRVKKGIRPTEPEDDDEMLMEDGYGRAD